MDHWKRLYKSEHAKISINLTLKEQNPIRKIYWHTHVNHYAFNKLHELAYLGGIIPKEIALYVKSLILQLVVQYIFFVESICPKVLQSKTSFCILPRAFPAEIFTLKQGNLIPVSYTHLTLPTICSV